MMDHIAEFMKLVDQYPLIGVLLVIIVIGGVYLIGELLFWWSMRRDARNLAIRQELTNPKWPRPKGQHPPKPMPRPREK